MCDRLEFLFDRLRFQASRVRAEAVRVRRCLFIRDGVAKELIELVELIAYQ